MVERLGEAEWRERRRAHEERVNVWLIPHQERAARAEKHPVYDFLFSYYSYRPSWLRRWHPGLGVRLTGEGAKEFLQWPDYRPCAEGEGVEVNVARLQPHRRESVVWLRDLLATTQTRAPRFGCFGLHEWAMVYRQTPEQVRHNAWPLRFAPEVIAGVVESLPINCTHFDAFRFFTEPARALNRMQPTRPTIPQFEQRGCLHANMDLYKWAIKLAPFAPSELVADCFELAREIREADMRASPYDVSALGFAPIKIETELGRAEYEGVQREFAERSEPLRARLLAVCEALLAATG